MAGNIILSKVCLASLLLYVISTWNRLLALSLQAEHHVVSHVPVEEDTQRDAFHPIRKEAWQAKHQNREVTLRRAYTCKGVGSLTAHPALRDHRQLIFFSRHIVTAYTEPGPVLGSGHARVRGRLIKGMVLELVVGVQSWFQRKLKKKLQ